MRLYHVPNSSSQRVLWLLEETGAPYELTILGDRASRVADAEHMARHPMGRVPVLEDEGEYIFESVAICLHVADRHPEANLIPPLGTIERAKVYQWSVFALTELQASLARARLLQDVDGERHEAAKANLADALAALEKSLDGLEYLVGDSVTVADVLVASVLAAVRRLGLAELPPRVSAYLEAMEARPAKARADARNPN